MAKALMVQGTGSGVGKSILVSALCRIFLQDGVKVAPFKAQNMALNSSVVKGGGEIGRAQYVQAKACRIEPTVDMNPVLMKPCRDTKAQIILRGKVVKNMSVYEYKKYKNKITKLVDASYAKLAREYELVVIEGAGSPAEINLKNQDIVNMRMAKAAPAPVILVGDIDNGGVFAWLVGTLQLLDESERKLVKGIIINKFRGDKRLLMSGVRFLEKYTGVKVLGVIPYFKDINIPEEDSLPLSKKFNAESFSKSRHKKINIAVVCFPHIANFTDLDPFDREKDVNLYYIEDKAHLEGADIVIIPGTKNTISDMAYLKKTGMAEAIVERFNKGEFLLAGICGGYQILGRRISDPWGVESKIPQISGLGLLDIETKFGRDKILTQVTGYDLDSGLKVTGYEMHHGVSKAAKGIKAKTMIMEKCGCNTKEQDGAVNHDGRCWGSYLHGIFDENDFRADFINRARVKKGLPLQKPCNADIKDREFDKLAALVRRNIDMKVLYEIVDGSYDAHKQRK